MNSGDHHFPILLITLITSVLLRVILSMKGDRPPGREPKPTPAIEFGIFQPVFFQDAEYVRLLHLADSEDASSAIDLVRECCQLVPSPFRDIQGLLEHPDWRPHLVAGVALVLSGHNQKTVDAAWRRIDTGSWVTPQLAGALSIVDPNFVAEAVGRLEILCPLDPTEISKLYPFERHLAMGSASARQRSAKTASALLRLLEIKRPSAAYKLHSNQDLQFLITADIDNSGAAAEHWLHQITGLISNVPSGHDSDKGDYPS